MGRRRVGAAAAVAERPSDVEGPAYWADGPVRPIEPARSVCCGQYVCRCHRDDNDQVAE